MMSTSPRFNVKGNTFEMVSSLNFDAEVQQRMTLVEWINSAVPHLYLSVKASDEDFRASLLDGDIFSQILQKLKYSFADEGDDSTPSTESRRRKVQRFIAAMSELGLPSFEITDLEKGSMRPVMDCLLALKEHTRRQFGSPVYKTMGGRPALSEIKFERSYSPLSPESPTMLLHGGNKFHEVFQMKQGFYADLPATKISEMIKSNSLDNAPTQSLLSVINTILDESIDRKNAAIPQRVAYLLRKVVQEIERRIATQAEHLRTQSNLFKAREEKYQSRIKVLDALAKGTSEESEIVMNQLKHMKYERSKMEENKRSQQQDMEEKKRSEQKQIEKKRYEQEFMEERKRFEQMMEEEKKRFEQMMEEKKRFEEHEANKLKKLREETNIEVSMLKQELETAKRMHELRFQELETEAQQLKSELEKKLRQQEQMLEDSKAKMKELELDCQSKSQNWSTKEYIYEKVMSLQLTGLEDLRRSSASVKQEMLTTQKTYLEELNHVGAKLKNLAKAAQSYHDVLNENRKLYNELQDLKGNIKVFCRVRPFLPGENRKLSIIQEVGEHGELIIANPAGLKDSEKAFRFNKVYGPMASQAEVFADTKPLIRTILDGYNVCIFAYGQTGSGKTYTMSGLDNASKEDWGVNYRALNDLFQVSEGRRNFFLYEIAVQMIEIYNEQIRDLLSNDDPHKKLGIMSTPQPHGLTVPDASLHPVRSSEDVIQLMNTGLKNRSVGATAMNERSSRSHSIVTIHVHGKDLKSGATTHGSLHLVDLAGSERVVRSEATGDRLKEAQHINKSLSSLGDVIFALAQKTPHVPYRNSKLTQVLQTSLGGRAKTLMFVQLNPDVSSYSETLSTLKFAERVSGVELGAARNNKEGKDVKDLTEQVASLKDSGFARRPGILHKSFDSFSDHFDPGFQLAFEDSENEGIRSSRSMNDLKCQKKQPGGTSMDDHMKAMADGDGDHEDRLSETSDSNFSIATDQSDATIESNISQEQSTSTDSPEKRGEKPKISKRHSQSPRAPAGASRLSQVKPTSREASVPKRPGKGSSSQVTSGSGRRWV
ncbi:kinesin-like protein KIN-14C [Silene latifolia]|uniref:kinesin-like protein KIN-14C n=1 Tax=Silene latifolia TaxID=37657 RepID=UPI003D774BA3